ncbi:MAG: hypothetical protein VW980_06495 [Flavobacteriales bacterium]
MNCYPSALKELSDEVADLLRDIVPFHDIVLRNGDVVPRDEDLLHKGEVE